MMKIHLTGKRGGFTLVSDEDYLWLSKFKWNHLKTGYAGRYRWFPDTRKRDHVLLHREIMGFPLCEVDHINGNRLDNRRENLRTATRSTNGQNAGSRYPRGRYGRNVIKMSDGRKKCFSVRCWRQGKPISGGYFSNLKQAQEKAASLRMELGYVA
jgi:hypothetical protein